MTQDGDVMFAKASLQKKKKITSIKVTAVHSCHELLQVCDNPTQFVGKIITSKAITIRITLGKIIKKDSQKCKSYQMQNM